jgi:hypothetical protein
MLVIQDEQLASALQQIAEREKRPVEDVLKSMLAQYPTESSEAASRPDKREAIKRVRRNAYAKARQYWRATGETAKAALTDEELDQQFGAFDEEGIPRLKSEIPSEPPIGSLAYAAKIAENSQLHSGKPDLARRSEDILDTYFADDVSEHLRGEDADE